MTHLTSDELVDALEGELAPLRQTHLHECEPCRQQLTALTGVLGEMRAVEVPEPSPLFWAHLSARVRTAIDAEPDASGGWSQWLRWPVLVPVAGLALLVMTLTIAVPRPPAAPPARAASTAEVESDAAHDDRFAIVADLVGDIDWDTAMSAGLTVEPGAADQAVLELTASEQQELTRLLRAELTRAKS